MDSVQKVKTRLGIVEVVSSYLDLQRSGKNYKAVCPFHSEDTPSFMVSPKLGIYKCFGCGASGDIFTFVQEMDGLDFYEALKKLADQAGVELEKAPKNEAYRLKKKLYKINEKAVEFYEHLLLKHKAGKQGLEYLTKKRGLSKEVINEYRLGYAPKTWDLLYKFLVKQGYKDAEMEKAGVVIPRKKGDGYIDKFRGRVMFPLIDTTGKVQGFMARTIFDDIPKYLNTSDTPVFNKSRFVFGLDKARISIKKKGTVFVEGPMDVISAYQAGIKNVVAPLGTSLTSAHLKIIARYTEDVTFCFDSDTAGLEAIKRAILLAEKQNLNIKVAMIPEKYRDLDEVLKDDADLAGDVLASAVSAYDFFIAYALKKHNKKSALGKKKIVTELAPIFSKISSEVALDHYVKELAEELETSEEVIYSALSSEEGKVDLDAAFGVSSTEAPVEVHSPIQDQEAYFLFLLLKLEDRLKMQPFLEKHKEAHFFGTQAKQTFTRLGDYVASSKGNKLDIKAFIDIMDESLAGFVQNLYLWQDWSELDDSGILGELEDVSERLEKRFAKKAIERLQKELSLAEKQGDTAKVKSLTERIRDFSRKIV
ncbi:DNA primase [candidate division WWE3 bacterium]|nr:DNA primase [candidate division WWE3 bacterium]